VVLDQEVKVGRSDVDATVLDWFAADSGMQAREFAICDLRFTQVQARLRQNSTTFVEEDAFEVHFEGLRVAGFGQGLLLADFAFLNQVE
jgi:hypothetical protein